MHNPVRGAFLFTVCARGCLCKRASPESLLKTEQRPLKAGFILVRDQPDQTAAAVFPEEALVRLGETLEQDVARVYP